MEPRCAGGLEPPGERDRVVLEAADLVELALMEPDRPAAEQVDGGDY